MNAQHTTGRLAPSPTGYLHLGNAWSFLLAWLSARLDGGTIFLRMEDIDPARSKTEFIDAALEDFAWLGINYDGEMVCQSKRTAIYEEYAAKLSAFTYPCYCTRKELREMAGAPQTSRPGSRFVMPDMGAAYHRTCRFLTAEEQARRQKQSACLRLACPPFDPRERHTVPSEFFRLSADFAFTDSILGKQTFNLNGCGGDFALRRSDKVWAYQLAVSVDDMLMGITEVVRGNDILTSTPRQLYLFRLFGHTPPNYAHIPLLLDAAGERLAKRHASLSLKALRRKDSSPAPVLQYLAGFLGLHGEFDNAADILQYMQDNIKTIWENDGQNSERDKKQDKEQDKEPGTAKAYLMHKLAKLGNTVSTDF